MHLCLQNTEYAAWDSNEGKKNVIPVLLDKVLVALVEIFRIDLDHLHFLVTDLNDRIANPVPNFTALIKD